ncbi:MAG TPA: cobalamin-binding protein [Actinomycetota bacterium]|jgi:iron complex transport system substrate-binding protein|nr:cobalamin-binding protein [Actinomycetota bacterium]
MRVVSLLPSATEIVYALGMGGALEAVTDECDFPPEATSKPIVSRSALPQGRPLSSREIDEVVRSRMDARQPLYHLDRGLIERVRPDVILTQDLCRVCAVPAGEVQRALREIGADGALVVSLDPHTLEEVLESIETVGRVLRVEDRARDLVRSLRARVEAVRSTALRLPSIRVFCLEWLDPPFVGGHWIPDMVEIAGGTNLLNAKGQPSRVVTWREIRDANPEVVLFMPCGYYLEEAEEEGAELYRNAEFVETPAAREGSVFAVDATSFFSRPGPRIVEGLEIMAWAIHPHAFPEPDPGVISQIAQ